jgi:hypothetical protein
MITNAPKKKKLIRKVCKEEQKWKDNGEKKCEKNKEWGKWVDKKNEKIIVVIMCNGWKKLMGQTCKWRYSCMNVRVFPNDDTTIFM